jgi:hypothetical protein
MIMSAEKRTLRKVLMVLLELYIVTGVQCKYYIPGLWSRSGKEFLGGVGVGKNVPTPTSV